MQITVNGASQEAEPGLTVAGLIDRLGLSKQACAVELNKQLVPKKSHGEARLAAGDRVEIVSLVRGG